MTTVCTLMIGSRLIFGIRMLSSKPGFVSLHIRSMWETICDAWACWSGWNFGPNSTEYPNSEIQFQNHPPPPRKWKYENCQRSCHFDFSVSESLLPRKWKLSEILALWFFSFRLPPTPPNLNLGRSWHFKIFQFQNNWYQWQTMCGNLPHVETLSSPDNYSFILDWNWYTSQIFVWIQCFSWSSMRHAVFSMLPMGLIPILNKGKRENDVAFCVCANGPLLRFNSIIFNP